MAIRLQWLGQAGLRLETPSGVIYVDPYLSDSVENIHGPAYRRMRPIPIAPHEVEDAAVVLITHEHLDHCDPETLPALAAASPEAIELSPSKTNAGSGVSPLARSPASYPARRRCTAVCFV